MIGLVQSAEGFTRKVTSSKMEFYQQRLLSESTHSNNSFLGLHSVSLPWRFWTFSLHNYVNQFLKINLSSLSHIHTDTHTQLFLFLCRTLTQKHRRQKTQVQVPPLVLTTQVILSFLGRTIFSYKMSGLKKINNCPMFMIPFPHTTTQLLFTNMNWKCT